MLKFVVQRESVCMGDDVLAPHQAELLIEQQESIENIITEILGSYHLASVASPKVTWTCALNNTDVARVIVINDERDNEQILVRMFEHVSVNLLSENEAYFRYR